MFFALALAQAKYQLGWNIEPTILTQNVLAISACMGHKVGKETT